MFYRRKGIICQCAVSFAPLFFEEIEKSQSTWPENSKAISGSILRCLIGRLSFVPLKSRRTSERLLGTRGGKDRCKLLARLTEGPNRGLHVRKQHEKRASHVTSLPFHPIHFRRAHDLAKTARTS